MGPYEAIVLPVPSKLEFLTTYVLPVKILLKVFQVYVWPVTNVAFVTSCNVIASHVTKKKMKKLSS